MAAISRSTVTQLFAAVSLLLIFLNFNLLAWHDAQNVASKMVETNIKPASAVRKMPAGMEVDIPDKSNSVVPRVLHFIHLSPGLPKDQEPPPKVVLELVEEWREMQPDWKIILWNNSMVQEHFPSVHQLAGDITQMSWVSNLVRYQAILKFGGVYLDTDIVAVHPLDSVLQYGPFAVCERPFDTLPVNDNKDEKKNNVLMDRGECAMSCNAVFGFPPGHPALQEVVDSTVKRSLEVIRFFAAFGRKPKHNLQNTGPPQWTRIIQKYSDVSVLRSFTFFPCHYSRTQDCILEHFRDNTQIIGMHQWAKSWNKSFSKVDYVIEAAIFTYRFFGRMLSLSG